MILYSTHCTTVLQRLSRRAGAYNTYRVDDHADEAPYQYADCSRPIPLPEPDPWWMCDWHGWDYQTSSVHAPIENEALYRLHKQSVFRRSSRVELNHLEWKVYLTELEIRRAKIGVKDIYGEMARLLHMRRDEVLRVLDGIEQVLITREVLGMPVTPPIPLTLFGRYQVALNRAA
jgi:hypothetical protein